MHLVRCSCTITPLVYIRTYAPQSLLKCCMPSARTLTTYLFGHVPVHQAFSIVLTPGRLASRPAPTDFVAVTIGVTAMFRAAETNHTSHACPRTCPRFRCCHRCHHRSTSFSIRTKQSRFGMKGGNGLEERCCANWLAHAYRTAVLRVVRNMFVVYAA